MPRPFHFSLQKVLEYREQLEERAKLAFSVALREHDAQADRVRRLRDSLTRHEARWFAEPMSAADIWLWRMYRQRLTEEIKEAEGVLARLRQEMEARRGELVEKSKDRKLLERLKSNKAMEHFHQENLKEQREFDEMATLRYQHRHF